MAFKRKSNSHDPLGQFGLIEDLQLDDDKVSDSDEDSGDLEEELNAILNDRAPQRAVRKPIKDQVMDIDKLVNDCLKDPSTDEDENSSPDDDDLLDELQALTAEDNAPYNKEKDHSKDVVIKTEECSPSHPNSVMIILRERLNLYKEAEAAAKSNSDASKLRRYQRAVKTLDRLLEQAAAGHEIAEEDIPPVVKLPKQDVLPTGTQVTSVSPEPYPPKPVSNQASKISEEVKEQELPSRHDGLLSKLVSHQKNYKLAALQAKRAGNNKTAMSLLHESKLFDGPIEALKSGLNIDHSGLPPWPPKHTELGNSAQNTTSQAQLQNPATDRYKAAEQSEFEKAALEAANEPIDPELFKAPPPPTNIIEALQQRLDKYRSTMDAALGDGLKSKARRLHRIVSQYEQAIKDYKEGKPVNYEELPTPPGFAPIPVESETPVPAVTAVSVPLPPPKVMPSLAASEPETDSKKEKLGSFGDHPAAHVADSSRRLDKQMQFLLKKKTEFQQSALKAKRSGDIETAKEYMRLSKGLDKMIEATRSGLPVDLSSIPSSPQLEADYVIIDAFEACQNELADDASCSLMNELKQQVEWCLCQETNMKACGDESAASKFYELRRKSEKDFVSIKYWRHNNEPIPKYHYQMRQFTYVVNNLDLGEDDLEVTVIKATNLPGKAESISCYVKLELPIPSENPQTAKTEVISNTNNPNFQEKLKFVINRKSRHQIRLFKRRSLKCEVWMKGGFFQKDKLIGTSTVKLVDLESKSVIHDSFNLLDGRKHNGGKLEIKIRMRCPLLQKQVEKIKKKWLVLYDH